MTQAPNSGNTRVRGLFFLIQMRNMILESCIGPIFSKLRNSVATQFIHNFGIELHGDMGNYINRRIVKTPDFTDFMGLYGVMETYEIRTVNYDAQFHR